MRRYLPSLTCLRGFETFSRHLNYTTAGAELNVSYSAVIQQVKRLEEEMGVKLVRKNSKQMHLTDEGEKLSNSLILLFSNLREAVSEVSDSVERLSLKLTMTPSFASEWFQPRIGNFHEEHPNIEIILHPSFDIVDLVQNDIDIAIRYGLGDWNNVGSKLFVKSSFVVVGASHILHQEKYELHELTKLPWLQELNTKEVEKWLANQGVVVEGKLGVTYMPGNMILPAMRDGCGIACTARYLVQDDIIKGGVRVLFEEAGSGGNYGYYIAQQRRSNSWATQRVIEWLYAVL